MFDYIFNSIKEAGEILKEGFFSSKKVSLKGRKDLITEYDVKIEKFLIDKFKNLNYSIIAEETTYEDFNNSIIIDPIDGTTNFVHQLPFVSISVGVYENKKPKYGFVYNPIMNEFFYAIKNKGAFLNGEKIEVSKENSFQKALIATGFPYSNADNKDDLELVLKHLKSILPASQDIRRFGSAALDLCYVASGKFDGFYEMNLKPWDVSAGVLIVKEANGVITNEKSEEFDMFRDKFIVASNGFIHSQFIDKFKF